MVTPQYAQYSNECSCLKISTLSLLSSFIWDRLVGLVVRASALGAEDTGFESCLQWDFSGSSHTCDLKIGTPVATLPGIWRYRVSAGTGQPSVSMLWLGEMESLICNFYLSEAACKIVWADPSLSTLACCWDVKQPTNKQTSFIWGKKWGGGSGIWHAQSPGKRSQ